MGRGEPPHHLLTINVLRDSGEHALTTCLPKMSPLLTTDELDGGEDFLHGSEEQILTHAEI